MKVETSTSGRTLRAVIAGGLVAAVTVGLAAFAGVPAQAAANATAVRMATVPSAAPEPPIVVDATGSGLGLNVTWLPVDPADEVTSFSVTASPVAGTETVACSSPVAATVEVDAPATGMTVPGLCEQVAYTATVVARNIAGDSVLSNVSDPAAALETQVASVPLIAGVLGRDGSGEVAWVAPAYDGGAPVTEYAMTVTDPAGVVVSETSEAGTATSTTLAGLTNDVEYQVTVAAVNSVGSSPPSQATLTPRAAYVPTAPQEFAAVPDAAGGIAVSWAAPVDDGGATVSSFEITYQRAEFVDDVWAVVDGAVEHTLTPGASSTTATASDFEEADASYLFTVAAVNSVGVGDVAVSQSAVSPQVEIKDTTVVLDESAALEVDEVTASSLVWNPSVPASVTSADVGDVLVADVSTAFPSGLLREVIAVDTAGDGTVTLATVDASLDDVFDSLSMSTSVGIDSPEDGAQSPSPLGKQQQVLLATSGVQAFSERSLGVELEGSVSASKVFQVNKKWKSGSVSAYVEGQVGVTAQVSVDVSVAGPFNPHATVAATATATARASVEAGIKGSKEWKLGTIKGAPVTFTVGPVPVIVVAEVPVTLQVSGDLKVAASAQVTVGGSVSWDSRDPSNLEVKNLSQPLTVSGGDPHGVTFTGSASIGFTVKAIAKIYGVGGPSVSATAKLSAEMDFLPNPGDPWLTITPSIEVKAGMAYDVVGLHGSLEVSIWKTDFAPFVSLSVPRAEYFVSPDTATVAAGGSQTFTATRSDSETSPITWKIKGGVAGDSITAGGVLTPALPEGRVITLVATDSSGASGAASVTVGILFSAPAWLSLSSSGDVPRSLQVAWAAPSQSGGADIADYLITTTPDTGTHVVTGRSLTINDIAPGNYSVEVRARSTSGRISVAMTRSIYISPPCTVTFTGNGDGNSWNEPANWSSNKIPGNDSWVCAPSNASIRIPTGFAGSVSGLSLKSGTLTIDGTLAVTASLIHERVVGGGRIDGSGSLTVGNSAAWTVSNYLNVHSDVVNLGTVTVNSSLNLFGATLTNEGILTMNTWVSEEHPSTYGVSKLVNTASGRVAATSDGSGSSLRVVNSGVITAAEGSDWSDVTNHGSIHIGAGETPVQFNRLAVADGTISGDGAINVIDRLVFPQTETLLDCPSGGYTLRNLEVEGREVTIPPGCSVDIASPFYSKIGIDIVNRGTFSVNGVALMKGTTFTNEGTLNLDGTMQLQDLSAYGPSSLDNSAGGMINASSAAEADLFVNNDGVINAAAGSSWTDLKNNGSMRIGAGSSPVDIGTLALADGVINGNGAVRTGGGKLVVPESGAVLGCPERGYTFDATTVEGGKLTIPPECTVVARAFYFPGTNTFKADVVNQGVLLVQDFLVVRGATLINEGTLELDQPLVGIEDSTTGVSSLINSTSGSIDAGSNSQVNLALTNFGAIHASAGSRWTKVENHGVFVIGVGSSSVSIADLTLDADSELNFALTPSDAGRIDPLLSVASPLTMNGTLSLGVPDEFEAEPGDAVRLINAASVDGAFAALTWVSAGHAPWALSYTGTNVSALYGVSAPAAAISNVSPASGSTAGGAVVTLTGANFAGTTSVTFGGVAGTGLKVISSTKITVVAPEHAAGKVGVVVTTPSGASGAKTFTYVAPSVVSSFSDVPTNYQFFTHISWLDREGITTGYADGTFRPNDEVSRAAMAAFLYRIAGSPSYQPPKTSLFSDVSTGYQFYKQVSWLEHEGITTGYADGTFRPNDKVSRAAMAAFLYRFAGSPTYQPPKKSLFSDVSTKYQFYKQVSWLENARITTGYADGTFRPNDKVSRAAMAAFLYRYDALPQ